MLSSNRFITASMSPAAKASKPFLTSSMFCSCSDIVSSLRSLPRFFGRDGLARSGGVTLGWVSDQSDHAPPPHCRPFPSDLQATLGIFTDNARKWGSGLPASFFYDFKQVAILHL